MKKFKPKFASGVAQNDEDEILLSAFQQQRTSNLTSAGAPPSPSPARPLPAQRSAAMPPPPMGGFGTTSMAVKREAFVEKLEPDSDDLPRLADFRGFAPTTLDPVNAGKKVNEVKVGTAFLHEADAERQAQYTENIRAFSEINNGSMLLLQLPSLSAEGKPSPLTQAGKLVVRRSGKVELVFNDVHYDVACSSALSMAQSVHAIVPQDRDELPACFELGCIQQKLTCVPLIDDA